MIGRDPAFQNQLAHGLDHWLARLDTRVGLKVGGWNGLAVGDANGDGLEDLYVCQSGGLPNRLFLARADGTAGDVAAAAGVDWLETSRGALFIDLDNDGDQDLVVSVEEGLLIHENDGSGRYTVRSAEVLPFAVPYSLATQPPGPTMIETATSISTSPMTSVATTSTAKTKSKAKSASPTLLKVAER